MTSLFDPMTSSSSPALDMLEGALDTEKSTDLQERKGSGSSHASPEPESVTVTVSTVRDDPSVAASSCLGSQSNHTQSYADPNAIQFQYRTDTNLENNHVHTSPTYESGHIRVVQVHGDEGDHTVDRVDVAVSGNNFVPSSHVAQQTVIQSPFPESPPTQVDNDSGRFTYYSSGGSEQGTAAQGENIDSNTAYIVRTVPVSGLSQPSSPIPATNVIPVTQGAQGQFYVMMPQDVLQGGNQRTIAPRSHPSNQKIEGQRTPRDEKRRATHNEVERRRRDKINNWIDKLAKMLPESDQDHTKQGQSKGGVLCKTVDYIHDLRAASARMADVIKENERLSIDVQLLRQQYDETSKENAMLRTQLQQHGIEPVSTSAAAQPH